MGRKNTGSIRHRGDCQFRASLSLDGKERSATFDTRLEAEQWLQDLRKQAEAGRAQDWLTKHECTLGQALQRYLEEVTPHKKSKRTEGDRIDCFLEREVALCDRKLYDIGSDDIKQLIKRRMTPDDPEIRPVTGSTMNRELALLSHLYNTARAEWGFEKLENPIIKGIRRKENKGRSRRLRRGEEACLLAAARAYEQRWAPTIPISAVIQFALSTGMRLGEIGRCSWDDVNLEEATLFLADTKNGESRTVPLYPSAVRLLASLERRADNLVFGPADSIRQMWTRVLATTDINGLRFHDLRHEAISRLFEGTDLSDMEIAAISGHKTLSQLKRYAHLRANKIARKLAVAEGARPLQVVVPVPPRADEDASASNISGGLQRWRAISTSKMVLEALVQKRPVSAIAAELGVSDVAIHKALERLGIEKPRQGWWSRAVNRAAA